MQYLSEVYKFTHGLGQKGHQIGRKAGDAIELAVMAMLSKDSVLYERIRVEKGVEGRTGAKHKVEFSGYNKNPDSPEGNDAESPFCIIECKKVGVEQTTKGSFKKFVSENKKPFYQTEGFSYRINVRKGESRKVEIVATALTDEGANIEIRTPEASTLLSVGLGDRITIASDTDGNIHIIRPNISLRSVEGRIKRCSIVTVVEMDGGNVAKITIDEALSGPQTIEKAKQASFVSLDVRNKVCGTFDKGDNSKGFKSVLVIGESSHWEDKSRRICRLCNDANLFVPDRVVIRLFEKFLECFGEGYQSKFTKTQYMKDKKVRDAVESVVHGEFGSRVLHDMDEGRYKGFRYCLDTGGLDIYDI